jgi:hypothetical protein
MGLDPKSPEFAAEKSQLSAQFEQIRQMSDSQYGLKREELINTLGYQTHWMKGRPTGPDSAPASRAEAAAAIPAQRRIVSDDEAVRRFFLRSEVAAFLQRRVAALSTPAAPSTPGAPSNR